MSAEEDRWARHVALKEALSASGPVGEHDVPCGHDRPTHGWRPAGCVKPRGHDTHWNGQGDTWRTDDEAYFADVAAAEVRGYQRAIAALRDEGRYGPFVVEYRARELQQRPWRGYAPDGAVFADYLESLTTEGTAERVCSTCEGAGTIRCLAHMAADGCEDGAFPCPDCTTEGTKP